LFHLGCSEQLAPQRYWLIQQKMAAQQRHGGAGAARRAGPAAGLPADGAGLTADQADQHFTGVLSLLLLLLLLVVVVTKVPATHTDV
jgi:hypothetical protein